MRSTTPFLSALQADRPLLSDGAMGTMLHSQGARFEQCFDELNLTQPLWVTDIHLDYIRAGAQLD